MIKECNFKHKDGKSCMIQYYGTTRSNGMPNWGECFGEDKCLIYLIYKKLYEGL